LPKIILLSIPYLDPCFEPIISDTRVHAALRACRGLPAGFPAGDPCSHFRDKL
jgi:hypothetical protein